MKNTSIQLFGDSRNHCSATGILPTRMMDNETLFIAAKAQQDTSMSSTQKLLNNRWLMESENNTYSGTTALRTVLRMGVTLFWKKSRSEKSKIIAANKEQTPKLAVLNWNNYDMALSSDSVTIGFSYRF